MIVASTLPPDDGEAITRVPGRTLQTCAPNETPPGALTKGDRVAWRRSIIRAFGEHARTIRIAWVLYDLSGSAGYAFIGDAALAREAGLVSADGQLTKTTRKNVQAALNDLVKVGAIIRVHATGSAHFERRIFLADRIVAEHGITPTVGVISRFDSPHGRGRNNPHGGDTEREEKRTPRARSRGTTTSNAARAAAELRDVRAAHPARNPWLDDV